MKPASTDYPPVLTTALLLVGVFSTVITLYACIKGGIGIIVYDYAYHTGISGCCLLLAPGIAFLKGEASRKVVLIPLSAIISLHVVAFLFTVSPLVNWTPTEAINTALPLAIGFYVSVALLLASLHVVYKQASNLDAGGIDEHDCASTEDASPETRPLEARLSSSRLSRLVSLWGGSAGIHCVDCRLDSGVNDPSRPDDRREQQLLTCLGLRLATTVLCGAFIRIACHPHPPHRARHCLRPQKDAHRFGCGCAGRRLRDFRHSLTGKLAVFGFSGWQRGMPDHPLRRIGHLACLLREDEFQRKTTGHS